MRCTTPRIKISDRLADFHQIPKEWWDQVTKTCGRIGIYAIQANNNAHFLDSLYSVIFSLFGIVSKCIFYLPYGESWRSIMKALKINRSTTDHGGTLFRITSFARLLSINWRHTFFTRYWWQNIVTALEIFLSMHYINLHFTYFLTYPQTCEHMRVNVFC